MFIKYVKGSAKQLAASLSKLGGMSSTPGDLDFFKFLSSLRTVLVLTCLKWKRKEVLTACKSCGITFCQIRLPSRFNDFFSSVAMLLRKNPKPFAIFVVSVVVPSSEFIACDVELSSPPLVGNIYVLVKYFLSFSCSVVHPSLVFVVARRTSHITVFRFCVLVLFTVLQSC